jgi:hypothetical protein
MTSPVTLSDESKETTNSILFPSLERDLFRTPKQLEVDRKTFRSNLTQKITSLYISNDPFENIYRAEWRAHTASDDPISAQKSTSVTRASSNDPIPVPDIEKESETKGQQPNHLNGKFGNITLQRVLALRKVQHAIKSAPNASAVGVNSTSFSEDDLECLTMEELQALQKRKRAIHKEVQPLSVVKVSIQAERSRKRLEPRDYQLELYERARRENTIAVLGTGTGKTLIACLLIKDILIQERANRASGIKVTQKRCLLMDRRKSAFLLCLWCI